jgi:hypothetical protein
LAQYSSFDGNQPERPQVKSPVAAPALPTIMLCRQECLQVSVDFVVIGDIHRLSVCLTKVLVSHLADAIERERNRFVESSHVSPCNRLTMSCERPYAVKSHRIPHEVNYLENIPHPRPIGISLHPAEPITTLLVGEGGEIIVWNGVVD